MANGGFIGAELREWTSGWWLLLVVGILSVAAGVIILFKPSDSLATLAVVAGIFVLADGIVELIASFSRQTQNRGLVALLGVLSAIVGIILIRHPIAGIVAIALLIGIWLVAVGVVRLALAFEFPEQRAWNIVAASLEILAGIVIVSSPDIGFATLALLAGIAFILNGIGLLGLGRDLHSLRQRAASGG
jgi:uncharacterized membrane protein HdeD (DUF308 family)